MIGKRVFRMKAAPLLLVLACVVQAACTATVPAQSAADVAPSVRYVLRSPDRATTHEPVVIRVDVFNMSRRPMFVREWSGHLACEYKLDTGDPLQFVGGDGRRIGALTHQPRYTRVAGCDSSASEENGFSWRGKGCAILTATAEIGPFETPGALRAEVSIPRTEYFLRGVMGTHYIEYEDELTIEIVAGEPETPAVRSSDGIGPEAGD